MKLKHVLLAGFCLMSLGVMAQAERFSQNSAHPINVEDIQYRAQIWRRMDLNEKMNQPFFAENNQISKILIEAVKSENLTAYVDDSLKTKLTVAQFVDRLKIKGKLENGGLSAEEIAAGFGGDGMTASSAAPSGGEDDGWGTKKKDMVTR